MKSTTLFPTRPSFITLGDDGKEVTLHSASPSNNFIANSNSPSDLEIPDFDAIFSEGKDGSDYLAFNKTTW